MGGVCCRAGTRRGEKEPGQMRTLCAGSFVRRGLQEGKAEGLTTGYRRSSLSPVCVQHESPVGSALPSFLEQSANRKEMVHRRSSFLTEARDPLPSRSSQIGFG